MHAAAFFVPPTHLFGEHVPRSYVLKFCGSRPGALGGTGVCRSTIVTLMAFSPGAAPTVTLNLRDRVVASGLLFGHGVGFVAGAQTLTPALPLGPCQGSQPQLHGLIGSFGVRQGPFSQSSRSTYSHVPGVHCASLVQGSPA